MEGTGSLQAELAVINSATSTARSRDTESAELGMQLLHEIFSSKVFPRYRMAIARAWGFVRHSASGFIPQVSLAGEGAGGAEPPSRADHLPPVQTNEAPGDH